jgi:hypothetical protein
MKKQPLLIILTLGLIFMSAECQKEKNQPDNTAEFSEFIFGSAYGFCAGNCVHLFKIAGGKVYADLLDRGDPAEATFSTTPLGDVEYQLALPVMEQFPEALLAEKSPIGCPDCHDQGGYFVQITKDGETSRWMIDTVEDRLPAYLRPYTKLIGEVVQELRE